MTYTFTDSELKDILIASILCLGVFISILIFVDYLDIYFRILIAVGGVLIFLTHEFSHKFMARRYGYPSEFRIIKEGALFTAISIIPFFPLKFIAPGSVFIKRQISNVDESGRVALAGPFSNFVLTGFFLLASGASEFIFFTNLNLASDFKISFYYIAYFSAIIGFFNMIPFGPLDGFKVLTWDKNIYIVVFGLALAIWLLVYSIGG